MSQTFLHFFQEILHQMPKKKLLYQWSLDDISTENAV